jgi:hypothetical protein
MKYEDEIYDEIIERFDWLNIRTLVKLNKDLVRIINKKQEEYKKIYENQKKDLVNENGN